MTATQDHPCNGLELPNSMDYSYQPFTYNAVIEPLGLATMTERVNGETRHYHVLKAIVLKGKEISRLGGHSSSRDIAGKEVTIFGVKPDELKRGEIVRVAG